MIDSAFPKLFPGEKDLAKPRLMFFEMRTRPHGGDLGRSPRGLRLFVFWRNQAVAIWKENTKMIKSFHERF